MPISKECSLNKLLYVHFPSKVFVCIKRRAIRWKVDFFVTSITPTECLPWYLDVNVSDYMKFDSVLECRIYGKKLCKTLHVIIDVI